MSALFWLLAGVNLTLFVTGLPETDWVLLGAGIVPLILGVIAE